MRRRLVQARTMSRKRHGKTETLYH
ncbi:hypothetical protein [Ellagibacter isourolithinifaciens]